MRPGALMHSEPTCVQCSREREKELVFGVTEGDKSVMKIKSNAYIIFGVDDEQPRTLKEIGESLGLTRERVRQIETEALGKLRVSLQIEV